MNSQSESFPLQNLSVPNSVRSETKQKFDALLKSALQKTKINKKDKTISKENLLSDHDSTTASSNNLLDKDDFEIVRQPEDNFILQKFLNDSKSSSPKKIFDDFVKPPVPKPRKNVKNVESRKGSITSQGTFSVTSPKIVKNKVGHIDSPNAETYNVEKENKIEEIGDLILHNSPSPTKISVISNNSALEKAETENIIDSASPESDIEILVESKPSHSKNKSISTSEISDNESESEKGQKKDQKKLKAKDVINLIEEKIKTSYSDEEKSEESVSDKVKSDLVTVKPVPLKRKKKKTSSEDSQSISTQEDEIKTLHEKKKKSKRKKSLISTENEKPNYDYEKIVNITIHKTDNLLINSFIIHPVVKVHIVDIKTGKYWMKSDKSRPVVFYFENEDTDYILPVMTHSYNLQDKRSLFPSWEETIIINEDFDHVAQPDVIFFFEILDFASFSSNNLKTLKDTVKGWHRICFAFLIPISKTNIQNLNKRVRLQLYHCDSSKKELPDECYLWKTWKSKKMKKYPSTFYVSIKSIKSPEKVSKSFRSKTPLQNEVSNAALFSDTFKKSGEEAGPDDQEITGTLEKKDEKLDLEKDEQDWGKDGKFQIPNKCTKKLDSFEEGCLIHKFSNNGLYLACAVYISEMYFIVVYSVKSFEEVKNFPCHQGLIYSIKWSTDDKYIFTASADHTVAIWNFIKNCLVQILPHPSFVYTVDVTEQNIIASGCFDGTIRIWSFEDAGYHLNQELEVHRGFVTSLCFNKMASLLYSADSAGKICVWEDIGNDWKYKMDLPILDVKGTIINHIQLFPNEKKMLIHTRDSTLRIISLKNMCVLHWLQGALNERIQIVSDISYCGNYVITGSENGLVNIWNAKNGEDANIYDPYITKANYLTINCTQFHPKANYVCLSHYGSNLPILIYKHEEPKEDIEYKKEVKLKSKFTLTKQRQSDDIKFDFKGLLQKMDTLLK